MIQRYWLAAPWTLALAVTLFAGWHQGWGNWVTVACEVGLGFLSGAVFWALTRNRADWRTSVCRAALSCAGTSAFVLAAVCQWHGNPQKDDFWLLIALLVIANLFGHGFYLMRRYCRAERATLIPLAICAYATAFLLIYLFHRAAPQSTDRSAIVIIAVCTLVGGGTIGWWMWKRASETGAQVLDYLWAALLGLGLFGSTAAFVGRFYQNNSISADIGAFIIDFLKNQAEFLFAVVLAAVLSDFVLYTFQQLSEVRQKVQGLGGEITANATTIKSSADKIEHSAQKSSTNVQSMEGLRKTIFEVAQQLHTQLQITKREASEASERLLDVRSLTSQFNDERDLLVTTHRYGKASRGMPGDDLMNALNAAYVKKTDAVRRSIAVPLNKYAEELASARNRGRGHAQCRRERLGARLATTFISQYFDKLTADTTDETESHPHLWQADFGVLAAVVDELYRSAPQIYEDLALAGTGQSLVYFTTLTMPPDLYLAAAWRDAFALPSVRRQWDMTRQRTRKVPLDWEMECGHMWRFLTEPDRFRFRRCCLFLRETTGRNEGICSIADWQKILYSTSAETAQLDLIKLYDPLHEMEFLQDFPSYGRRFGLLPRPPQRLELLSEDPQHFVEKEAARESELWTCFRELYHPFSEDCKALGLDFNVLRHLVRNESGSAGKYRRAFDDEQWQTLIDKAAADGPADQKWTEVFFNEHIPVDVFAIGTVPRNSNPDKAKPSWLGCVGGYVGGDFANMRLSWFDTIATHRQWPSMENYLSFVYENGGDPQDVVPPPEKRSA